MHVAFPKCTVKYPKHNLPDETIRLKHESRTLGLLVTTELEVFAPLEGELSLGLAGRLGRKNG